MTRQNYQVEHDCCKRLADHFGVAALAKLYFNGELGPFDGRWHLIGSLQRNKVRLVVDKFALIHSIDRSSLLDALVKEARTAERFPTVYVQVNIGEEEQKGGCAIAEVGRLVDAVRASPLPLAGLMAIPPLGVEPGPFFALLAKLAQENGLTGLSMGMSSDFKPAIMLGATAVRIGTALFED